MHLNRLHVCVCWWNSIVGDYAQTLTYYNTALRSFLSAELVVPLMPVESAVPPAALAVTVARWRR